MKQVDLPQINTKLTVLVYCEGLEDSAFVKHLHDLYHQPQYDARVKIISGRGGTADGIVSDALKEYGGYDYRIVVLDNDKSKDEMDKAQVIANKNSIVLVCHTPCIEHLLLTILDDKSVKAGSRSRTCKNLFEKIYFVGRDRTDWRDYRDVFPKRMLNEKMKVIKKLKKLYRLARGKVKTMVTEMD